jgi:hypothetical protein
MALGAFGEEIISESAPSFEHPVQIAMSKTAAKILFIFLASEIFIFSKIPTCVLIVADVPLNENAIIQLTVHTVL